LDDLISKAAGDLMAATYVIALTGAGISVESGIPPFRGTGGIWEKIDPMEYAHIDAFMSDPVKVWDVLIRGMKDVVDQALPNDAQNVDGLHQAAGSTDVIEFHGNFAWQSCLDCGRRRPTRTVGMDRLPPRCSCGGILRPECVFFGEQIPPRHLSRSQLLAMQCDIMLVIGTSATVQPAATIPVISKQSGARVIEINAEPTPLTHSVSDYLIAGRAGEVMHRIVMEVERKKRLG
jgi:NAD-dependent deacetylase